MTKIMIASLPCYHVPPFLHVQGHRKALTSSHEHPSSQPHMKGGREKRLSGSKCSKLNAFSSTPSPETETGPCVGGRLGEVVPKRQGGSLWTVVLFSPWNNRVERSTCRVLDSITPLSLVLNIQAPRQLAAESPGHRYWVVTYTLSLTE